MKFFRLSLVVLPAFALNAQTNLPLPALIAGTNAASALVVTNTPPRERPPINIDSEHCMVDLKTRVVVYSGDVLVVVDPQMKMNCDVLTAKAPTNSTHLRVEQVIAEHNVKIVGQDDNGQPVHVICDKAIYFYNVLNSVTNETVTFTGNVDVDSAMFKGTGEPIIWDRVNSTIHADKTQMQIQTESAGGTNAPSSKKLIPKFP